MYDEIALERGGLGVGAQHRIETVPPSKSSSWKLLIQTLNNIQNKNTLPNQFIICHMGCKNHILHEPARKRPMLGGVYTCQGWCNMLFV